MLNILSYRSTTNSICKLQIVYQSLIKTAKYRNSVVCRSLNSSSKPAFETKNARECSKQFVDVINVNTNVQNNVMLYKNTSSTVFIKLVFFGWGFCNIIIALMTFNPKYVSTWFEDLTWTEYLKRNGIALMYFIYSVLAGPLGCVALYIFNHRIIKYIILHKGGKDVSIVTNHLFKNVDTITLPLEKVKTTMARDQIKNYLPLKIQGKKFFYLVDGHGKFFNEQLFDYTVGRAKTW
ncbi:uncharacterized protein LOC122528443 [Frieseomelitta varia]|nr:uncharacterized protein LOC122528443 [Frieseomelitta varia]